MRLGLYLLLGILCMAGVIADGGGGYSGGGGGGSAPVIVEADEKETIVVPARTILKILGVIAFIGLLLFGWWITQPTNK